MKCKEHGNIAVCNNCISGNNTCLLQLWCNYIKNIDDENFIILLANTFEIMRTYNHIYVEEAALILGKQALYDRFKKLMVLI